jgi:hypothetical protein
MLTILADYVVIAQRAHQAETAGATSHNAAEGASAALSS